MKKNENGYSLVEVLLLVFVVGLISFVGWYVWQAKTKANLSLSSAANEQYVTKTPISKKSAVGSPQSTVATPAPTPTPSPSTTSKSSHTTTPSPAPAPTPAPVPPVLTPSLNLSADGCTATANGTQGFILDIWVYKGNHGGEPTYALPFSGTLTVSTGAEQGGTTVATLKNASGSELFQQTVSNVPAACPAASAGAL